VTRPRSSDVVIAGAGIIGCLTACYLAAGHWPEGLHYGPLTGAALAGMIVDGVSEHDISALDPARIAA